MPFGHCLGDVFAQELALDHYSDAVYDVIRLHCACFKAADSERNQTPTFG